jgi:hypothetical protein
MNIIRRTLNATFSATFVVALAVLAVYGVASLGSVPY